VIQCPAVWEDIQMCKQFTKLMTCRLDQAPDMLREWKSGIRKLLHNVLYCSCETLVIVEFEDCSS